MTTAAIRWAGGALPHDAVDSRASVLAAFEEPDRQPKYRALDGRARLAAAQHSGLKGCDAGNSRVDGFGAQSRTDTGGVREDPDGRTDLHVVGASQLQPAGPSATPKGGYRHGLEVDEREVRIMGHKSALPYTLVAASSGTGVRHSFAGRGVRDINRAEDDNEAELAAPNRLRDGCRRRTLGRGVQFCCASHEFMCGNVGGRGLSGPSGRPHGGAATLRFSHLRGDSARASRNLHAGAHGGGKAADAAFRRRDTSRRVEPAQPSSSDLLKLD